MHKIIKITITKVGTGHNLNEGINISSQKILLIKNKRFVRMLLPFLDLITLYK